MRDLEARIINNYLNKDLPSQVSQKRGKHPQVSEKQGLKKYSSMALVPVTCAKICGVSASSRKYAPFFFGYQLSLGARAPPVPAVLQPPVTPVDHVHKLAAVLPHPSPRDQRQIPQLDWAFGFIRARIPVRLGKLEFRIRNLDSHARGNATEKQGIPEEVELLAVGLFPSLANICQEFRPSISLCREQRHHSTAQHSRGELARHANEDSKRACGGLPEFSKTS